MSVPQMPTACVSTSMGPSARGGSGMSVRSIESFCSGTTVTARMGVTLARHRGPSSGLPYLDRADDPVGDNADGGTGYQVAPLEGQVEEETRGYEIEHEVRGQQQRQH